MLVLAPCASRAASMFICYLISLKAQIVLQGAWFPSIWKVLLNEVGPESPGI